jgi:hypothetical protein
MEEFEEEFDSILEIKKSTEMQDKLIELKIRLVKENYENIIENGIDIKGMIKARIDVSPLIHNLDIMIATFQDLEEYEKCAVLMEYKNIASAFINIK